MDRMEKGLIAVLTIMIVSMVALLTDFFLSTTQDQKSIVVEKYFSPSGSAGLGISYDGKPSAIILSNSDQYTIIAEIAGEFVETSAKSQLFHRIAKGDTVIITTRKGFFTNLIYSQTIKNVENRP